MAKCDDCGGEKHPESLKDVIVRGEKKCLCHFCYEKRTKNATEIIPPRSEFCHSPIHYHRGSWWFWDETCADRHGPYPSKERAESAAKYYALVYQGHSLFLCYSELHVDDQTFLVHVIVAAETEDEALDRLETRHGDHYHLQPKGILGKVEHPGTNLLQYLDLLSPEKNC